MNICTDAPYDSRDFNESPRLTQQLMTNVISIVIVRTENPVAIKQIQVISTLF